MSVLDRWKNRDVDARGLDRGTSYGGKPTKALRNI